MTCKLQRRIGRMVGEKQGKANCSIRREGSRPMNYCCLTRETTQIASKATDKRAMWDRSRPLTRMEETKVTIQWEIEMPCSTTRRERQRHRYSHQRTSCSEIRKISYPRLCFYHPSKFNSSKELIVLSQMQ